ncbi:MAG: hypothetical protein ACJ77A_06515 [Actinomycetota bacterium]
MRHRAARLPLRLALGCLVAAAWALVSIPAAGAAPSPPSTPVVTARGSAAGDLVPGTPIRVRLVAIDSHGWQRIEGIEVALELRGQPLDRMVVTPTGFSVVIVNSGAPISIGQVGTLQGPFFKLDDSKMTVTAKGTRFQLAFPVQLVAAPPPGARLFLTVTDVSGVTSRQVPLSPPVTKADNGFPWGTIGLAVAGALFIGAFVGNTFSTRRSRVRPNVYATVARRLQEEERAKR